MSSISPQFVEFSKPFIDALKKTFESMIYAQVTAGKPELKASNTSYGDISAIMGLNGSVEKNGKKMDFKGQFVISFPTETYIKAASAMLMEEYSEYCDEIADAGAEICNMITGNAKKDLAPMGYSLGMAVPSTISGKNHSITYPTGVTVIAIPIESNHGKFFVEICYQDQHSN